MVLMIDLRMSLELLLEVMIIKHKVSHQVEALPHPLLLQSSSHRLMHQHHQPQRHQLHQAVDATTVDPTLTLVQVQERVTTRPHLLLERLRSL
jgi:hypothetical protein